MKNFMGRRALRIVACTILAYVMAVRFFSWTRPPASGVKNGRLAPCPDKPNCVCSMDLDDHAVAPFAFSGDGLMALDSLKKNVLALPRTYLAESSRGYLRIEFTTRLLRFVDDVEFLLDDSKKVIHVRSASRIGHSDLGANAARVAEIRQRLEKIPAFQPAP